MRANLKVDDFLREQEDQKGVRHKFFDCKAFSNFIEEDSNSYNNNEEVKSNENSISRQSEAPKQSK